MHPQVMQPQPITGDALFDLLQNLQKTQAGAGAVPQPRPATPIGAGAPIFSPHQTAAPVQLGRGREARGGRGQGPVAAVAAAGKATVGRKSSSSSAEPASTVDAIGQGKRGGAHQHFSADELRDLVICVAPEYQAGNRGDINWVVMALKLHNMGHAQLRTGSSLQNKFRVLVKSYQTIKLEEEKGTGAHVGQ
jgi:hypothetical protein